MMLPAFPRLRVIAPAVAAAALAVAGGGAAAAQAPPAPAPAPAPSIAPDELARVKADEAARVRAIESVYGAVVAIFGASTDRGGGSGVLFDPDGFALTNNHVVRAAGRSGKAGLADGALYAWDLYGTDPGGDLAIIRLRGKPTFPCAPLGDSRAVRVGDPSIAMGNPFLLAEDYKPTVTFGIVSGVERFQHGQGGGQTGVYGNCIQIDTSINPGNSGGPLFDLQGCVIGINGRGSFEERGRVNVGVGYAISIEQAKNFLPDLLATKLCQHGTLDATFRDEEGKVICNQINEESPVAKQGLKLGDRLVAFEGVPIRTANQYLNLVSTLPAGWPAAVTFHGSGGEKTAVVRLRPIPYPQPPRRPTPAQDRKGKEEKKEEKKEGKEEKDGPKEPDRKEGESPAPEKPAEKGKAEAKPAPIEPRREPGKAMNADFNRHECGRLLDHWLRFLGGREALGKVPAFRCEETASAGGKPAGRRRVLRHADGRFRAEALEDLPGAPAGATWGYDGTACWKRRAGRDAGTLKPAEAFDETPEFAAAWVLAALAREKPLEAFKAVELEGSDKAAGQRAFRIRVDDREGNTWLYWFSVLDERDRLRVRLLKAAADTIGKGDGLAWTFGDDRTVSGVRLPHRRCRVRGLAEQVELEWTVVSCEAVEKPAEEAFRP
jgi:serine protease Do